MARSPGEPRVRYIALRIKGEGTLTRRGLIDTLRNTGQKLHGSGFEQESGLWLTRFDQDAAIVRCHHTHQDPVRQLLEQVRHDPKGGPLQLEPIATSGTIRTLVEKHVPHLKEDPRRREKAPSKTPKTQQPPRGPRRDSAPRRR
jgi:RNase P/RNase MRP subunit POP5